MMRVLLLLVCLALVGACRSEVSRTTIGLTTPVTETQSCSYAGYCFSAGYGIGVDAKASIGYKFGYHYSCSGRQTITGTRTPTRITYDDYSTRDISALSVATRGVCR